jgi:methyl-accepting chemotaxis protein
MRKKLGLKPVRTYLDPVQKARLEKRARQEHISMSEVVRRAIDLHLELPFKDSDEMAELAKAANQSADRILHNLDAAIHSVSGALSRMGKKLATT